MCALGGPSILMGRMKIRLLIVLGTWASFSSGCAPSGGLSSLSGLWSGDYRVAPYVRAAARLHAMGRAAACEKLLEAAKTRSLEEPVIVLCRMLFVRRGTSEFRGPMIGAASFFGGTEYADWPSEPIELVDGIPFLITRGYMLGGSPAPSESYVRHCMTACDWTPVGWGETTEVELRGALAKLLASVTWKRSLDATDREFFSNQIR